MSNAHRPARWIVRVPATAIDEHIDLLKQYGWTDVELRLSLHDDDADASMCRIRDAASRLRDSDLNPTAVCVTANASQNIGVSQPSAREAACAELVSLMDLAAEIGAALVTISPAVVTHGNDITQRYEDAYHFSLQSMIGLRFEAAARCIRIACRLGSAGFLLSPMDARLWLDEVNSPWVGGRIDPLGIAHSGCPTDWTKTLAHRIFAADFSDLSHTTDAATQRCVDWRALLRLFNAIDNDVAIAIPADEAQCNSARSLIEADT